MSRWIRFAHRGQVGFGTIEGDIISCYRGDLFSNPTQTSKTLPLDAVKLQTPCMPSKMVALWNNFHALAAKLEQPVPEEPLYFLKAGTSFLAGGETIARPASYGGRVIYEGELGIVIGRTCSGVPEDQAGEHIFGYTCINDVTAVDLIQKDPTFPQWARAKSFDGFGVFGPVIATDIDPMECSVRTVLNGVERQNYPLADMVHPPRQLVSRISRDMTLLPGDVIACGTSLGVGSMKEPRNEVEVTIEGIGTLSNVFAQ